MLSVFYQRKPEHDTPYRTLRLWHDPEKGFCVRLTGGTKFEPNGDSEVLKEKTGFESWEDGKIVFDEMFNALTEDRWRLYSPQEDWEPKQAASFQGKVNNELPKPRRDPY
jgi:hypothetical protein